nr:MAG TPA: hypothetical protein [Caudoviricetes sp.]
MHRKRRHPKDSKMLVRNVHLKCKKMILKTHQ